MSNNMPYISVIMPVYNGKDWLDESIQSVLKQTYANLELILVNDESTDDSLDIIQKYAERDNRVVVFSNKNSGPGESLNFGLRHARGKYVCFIDQDDRYHETYLERMLAAIEKYQTDFVVCYGEYFNSNHNFCRRIAYSYYEEGCYDLSSNEAKVRLFDNFFPQWTKIISKEFLEKNHILFPGRHNKVHDVPFHMLCVWFASSFAVVPEALYFHRLHDKQITHGIVSDFATGYIESFKDLEAYAVKYLPDNKNFISYAMNLFIPQATKKQKRYMSMKRWQYGYKEKLKRIFYHKKIKNNVEITRILCFVIRKKKIRNTFMTLMSPTVSNCGRHSYCASEVFVANPEETVIGNFVSIGENVRLGHGNHPLNFISTSPYFYFDALGFKKPDMPSYNDFWYYDPVIIGNDVWIGDNVFVKNGVRIGTGAVVGAHSVVTKDIPPYAIVAGVPAKIIRYRFDKDVIAKLLASKWWLMDDDTIKKIPFDDVAKALQFIENNSRIKKNI